MKRAVAGCVLALLAVTAGCQKPIEWQNYTSKEGNYSAQMPGTPKSQSQQEAGLTVHADTVELSNGAYAVSYTDLPKGAPFDLDGAVKGVVSGMKGELVQSKEITLEGKPGREFTFKIPGKGAGAARLFVKDGRLYQLIVAGSNVDLSSDDVQKFFTSFKLEK